MSFAHPPVAEVAISVQFARPVLDATRALGDFWPRIRNQYPTLQAQPPIPPMEVGFEVPTQPRIVFNVAGPDSTRYLFVSERGSDLVQVQDNRLGYNWRKQPLDEPYRRYLHVREHFEAALDELLGVIGDVELPWCEIAYVNPIVLVGPGEPRPNLSQIVRRVADVPLSALPANPINSNLSERFRVEREDGTPYAWFFIEAEPAVDENQTLSYNVTLLMRGQPAQPDKAGVLGFIDDGRRRIVNTFRDITTPEMHDRWGLE